MASGPSAATCAAVDERDQQCCVRCARYVDGGSRHHRKLRRSGDHTPANLILLCGSGTTGCHGWVHSHPAESYRMGWLVHSWHDPASVPVLAHGYSWLILDIEGISHMISTEDARAIRSALGLVS